ncbi:MAG: hypothetical protein HYY18_10860 [Planctomycetes bacterium]|nr:hypothetical protein [Planctomycetota bacterium]
MEETIDRTSPLTRFALPLAVFLMTGGFGILVPDILGLRTCQDFLMTRIFELVLLAGLFFAIRVAVHHAIEEKWDRKLGFWSLALLVSGVVNIVLGQDPLAAWLNCRAPFVEFDPEWGNYPIADHEHLYRDEPLDLYYVGGPGVPVPDVLRDK